MNAGRQCVGSVIDIKVIPNSRKTCVEFAEDFLKVKVTKRAEGGAANKEVERIFHAIDRGAKIVSGLKSPRKKLFLPNVCREELDLKLSELTTQKKSG